MGQYVLILIYVPVVKSKSIIQWITICCVSKHQNKDLVDREVVVPGCAEGNVLFPFFPYQMFRKCPSSKESDGEQNEAEKLSHIIKELATSFGLDPDVALSQAQTFL